MLQAFAIWQAVKRIAKLIPWQVWCGIAVVAALYVWGNHREAQGRSEGRAEMQAQIDAADKARADALASEEAALRKLTKETDRAVIQAQDDNRDRTERFIARGGVRNACPAAVNPPADRSAGDSAPVHQAPVLDGSEQVPTVAVMPEDVRTCTTNTILAEEWRKLLLGLESR
jgi:hypothetical protein